MPASFSNLPTGEEATQLLERLTRAETALAALQHHLETERADARRLWAEAEAAQRRLAFLDEAGEVLARSLDYETTLTNVAHLAVPYLADWCVVDLAAADGSLQRMTLAHADPAKAEMARRLRERAPMPAERPEGPGNVFRTGWPELAAEVSEALLRALAHDEQDLQVLRRLNLCSYLCVPLQARGRTLGVMIFLTAESGRRYGREDLAVAREVARRAALAVDHAELYHQAREASERKDESLARLDREITERRRAEEHLKTSLREKEVLLKEVHHRVKNNLQIISSLLRCQADAFEEPTTREALRASQHRIRSMALIHEKLYLSPDLSRIDFAEYVRSLTAELFRSYEAQRRPITLRLQTDPLVLNVDRAIPCGLILNELMSNALKYAFPEGFLEEAGLPGNIRVEVRSDGEQMTLVVADNGIGLPRIVDVRQADTLGLQLVSTLTDQLTGTLRVRVDGGSEFTIAVPLA